MNIECVKVAEFNYYDIMDRTSAGSFKGLSLNWVEYEILKAIMKNIRTAGELYPFIIQTFPVVEYSQSQFYRIVNSLVKRGFLQTSKSGQKNLLTLTDRGVNELGILFKYVLENLRDLVLSQGLWFELIKYAVPSIGCLRGLSILVVAPMVFPIPYLLDQCKRCEKPIIHSDKKVLYIKLPGADGRLDQMHQNEVQIIDTPNVGDWLPKDESIDLVLLSSALQVFESEKIMEETKRVLRPGGHIIVMEPTDVLPEFVLRLYNLIISVSEESKSWQLSRPLITRTGIRNLLEERNNFEIIHEGIETLMSIWIAKKVRFA